MDDIKLPDGWESIVTEIAATVCRRRFFGMALRADFEDEAISFIRTKGAYFDPAKGTFESWCYRVLKNRAIDFLRNSYRQEELVPPFRVSENSGRLHWLEEKSPRLEGNEQLSEAIAEHPWSPERPDPELLTATFKSEDFDDDQAYLCGEKTFTKQILRRCESLPVLCRVVVFALTGLWRAVPAEDWESWLRETDINPPFPPPELMTKEFSTNVKILAGLLGTSEAAIRQHYYRALRKLKRL